ncbi:DMT family transporter [Fuerstiella marisgermanici]|uniref:EamA-like transporter family protein n=1 Tax=Fuerstiella marisgermanici TaxID=1891926 RepID=A0A1P8WJX2_9PLAN|nr:DMT family transporter [Fuerstiella marisgermanici]APZ94354.1 EamA-like transporter family protein [Fuerstiella marisgermanici]
MKEQKSDRNMDAVNVSPPLSQNAAPVVGNSVNRGLALGLCSAVCYSAANLALRGLSGRHADSGWEIWVTAMKAGPTVLLSLGLLLRLRLRKEAAFPSFRPVPWLLAAALIMQFGGNLGFQLAMGQIGLAITVPLVFTFIIIAGAALGRTFLGDTVSKRTVVSIMVMLVSIILLSYAATLNAPELGTETKEKIAWLGIVLAVISGMSYGINGIVIRRISQRALPIASMLFVYSTTGLVLLTAIGWNMLGTERILQIQRAEWQMMLAAGTFNAIAFFCVTNALKLLNITQVNVINATQNAMCAAGAVIVFSEPHSIPMVSGIALSIVGLLLLDRK